MSRPVKKNGKVRYINHQPGNATRYDIYLVELEGGDWLVSIPNFQRSLIVNEGSVIDDGYVWSKLKAGTAGGIVDASEIAKVVAREIGTEWRGCTDENGRYIEPPAAEST
jgi:hypothetical protein